MRGEDAADQFWQHAARCLRAGTLVRLRLSSPRPSPPQPDTLKAVLARPVQLKAGLRLSVTRQYPTRDEVKNYEPEEGLRQLQALLPQFQSGYLSSAQGDWQWQHGEQGGRLIAHPPRLTGNLSLRHDHEKSHWLDATAQDWLHGLGITTAEGHVAARQADKHRQVARYVEIMAHLARAAGWGPPAAPMPLTLADMGCGKGYLTFGIWHLFRRRWQWPVTVLGLEQRPELVEHNRRLARQIGAEGLDFRAGTIAATPLPRLDVLLALHACDTATDDALLQGIRAGARLVVVAPCCHKQLRPQLGKPAPLAPLLRHGLLAGRFAEWLTDGLRTLYLEWAGYQTRVVEFVPSEHTPRNLMLAGVRRHPPFSRPALREQIVALKTFCGIQHHALDALLDGPADSSPAS
ncbi:MAG: SAM-dependent methyltransferase [Verrucomicrobiae bacterium]|nr:SAM-dependent methyltransferase [Verrucomicrobiae bacterium]